MEDDASVYYAMHVTKSKVSWDGKSFLNVTKQHPSLLA